MDEPWAEGIGDEHYRLEGRLWLLCNSRWIINFTLIFLNQNQHKNIILQLHPSHLLKLLLLTSTPLPLYTVLQLSLYVSSNHHVIPAQKLWRKKPFAALPFKKRTELGARFKTRLKSVKNLKTFISAVSMDKAIKMQRWWIWYINLILGDSCPFFKTDAINWNRLFISSDWNVKTWIYLL